MNILRAAGCTPDFNHHWLFPSFLRTSTHCWKFEKKYSFLFGREPIMNLLIGNILVQNFQDSDTSESLIHFERWNCVYGFLHVSQYSRDGEIQFHLPSLLSYPLEGFIDLRYSTDHLSQSSHNYSRHHSHIWIRKEKMKHHSQNPLSSATVCK